MDSLLPTTDDYRIIKEPQAWYYKLEIVRKSVADSGKIDHKSEPFVYGVLHRESATKELNLGVCWEFVHLLTSSTW